MQPPQPRANLPPLPHLKNDGNEDKEADNDDIEVAAPSNDLGTRNLNDNNESNALEVATILIGTSETTAI